MDEPFSALDPITRDQLQQEVLELQDEFHKTIVFVTLDMDEALKIADKIAVLHDGEIIQHDVPEEILKHPANDYVREFVGNNRLWQSPEYLYAKDVMRTDVALIGTKRSPASLKLKTIMKLIYMEIIREHFIRQCYKWKVKIIPIRLKKL